MTARQQEILNFIVSSSLRPPSIREIARRFGITSPNGVMCHLHALRSQGLLQNLGGSRGWVPSVGMVADDNCVETIWGVLQIGA